jgi:MFS family permease
VIGFCPVFLLPFLYHRLPESTKFIQQQPQQPAAASLGKVLRPVTDLVRAYPGRFMASGLLFFLVYLAGFAAVFYNPTYLQEAHHWQPWHVSLLMMSAGLLGFLGSIVAGLMGDRVGRKRSTAFFLIGAFCFIVAFYNISGLLLPILWAGMAFYVMGGNVALNTLQTELFPTSYRATATGALAFVRTLGSALSLAMHGILFALTGSQWFAITLLAFLLLPTPLILALTLPETSGRPLEEISPER